MFSPAVVESMLTPSFFKALQAVEVWQAQSDDSSEQEWRLFRLGKCPGITYPQFVLAVWLSISHPRLMRDLAELAGVPVNRKKGRGTLEASKDTFLTAVDALRPTAINPGDFAKGFLGISKNIPGHPFLSRNWADFTQGEILVDEWDCRLVVAECEHEFVSYYWTTTA